MSANSLLALITVGGICQIVGAILCIVAMKYNYSNKSKYQRNAEWGLVVILLMGFSNTILEIRGLLSLAFFFPNPNHSILVFRILFLWIPANLFLHAMQSKKRQA